MSALTLESLEQRVIALETRSRAVPSAEHWLLQDARKLGLARLGYYEDAHGHLQRFDPSQQSLHIQCCEQALSQAVDTLVKAATADGLGLKL